MTSEPTTKGNLMITRNKNTRLKRLVHWLVSFNLSKFDKAFLLLIFTGVTMTALNILFVAPKQTGSLIIFALAVRWYFNDRIKS